MNYYQIAPYAYSVDITYLVVYRSLWLLCLYWKLITVYYGWSVKIWDYSIWDNFYKAKTSIFSLIISGSAVSTWKQIALFLDFL